MLCQGLRLVADLWITSRIRGDRGAPKIQFVAIVISILDMPCATAWLPCAWIAQVPAWGRRVASGNATSRIGTCLSVLCSVDAEHTHEVTSCTAIPSQTYSGGQLLLFRLDCVVVRTNGILARNRDSLPFEEIRFETISLWWRTNLLQSTRSHAQRLTLLQRHRASCSNRVAKAKC